MKKLLIASLIVAILMGSTFLFWNDIVDLYLTISTKLPEVELSSTNLLKEAEKHVSAPPPLRAFKEIRLGDLTQSGVLKQTNLERTALDIPPLEVSPVLNLMAEAKVKDMFEKQYFAHISPTGEGAGDLAESFDYDYIAVGENLAMGDFESDSSLVDAWMESPGHRENILSERYQEIGIAVMKGSYENQTIWMAVQHFGLPASACLSPDELLRVKIEENNQRIYSFKEEMDKLKGELESNGFSRVKFNQKVREYNDLVYNYNELVRQTKELVNEYNKEVNDYNACVAGN